MALVTTGEGGVLLAVASVEIVMLSVYPYQVLVERYILRNKVFVGLVYCSEIDSITMSW